MQFMEIAEAFLCSQGVKQGSSKGRHSDGKNEEKTSISERTAAGRGVISNGAPPKENPYGGTCMDMRTAKSGKN